MSLFKWLAAGLALSLMGHFSAAEAQMVQRECRPQVVQTGAVNLHIPNFPAVYNISPEEVTCCDTDGSNALFAGQVYVQIQHGRTEGDAPISCSGGDPILVARDIAGPADRGDAPPDWPFIQRSTFFRAIEDLTPGWNGQGFIGVQRDQIIEFACPDVGGRFLRVALIDCPCGAATSGFCIPRPSRNTVQPSAPMGPGSGPQAGSPGNQLLVPPSPILPSR